MPSEREVENIVFQNRPWQDPSYCQSQLEEAGLADVKLTVEEIKVDCGTPAQLTDTMTMPLRMVGSFWEEGRREELVTALRREFENSMAGEVGKEGTTHMNFKAIVATGWKVCEVTWTAPGEHDLVSSVSGKAMNYFLQTFSLASNFRLYD